MVMYFKALRSMVHILNLEDKFWVVPFLSTFHVVSKNWIGCHAYVWEALLHMSHFFGFIYLSIYCVTVFVLRILYIHETNGQSKFWDNILTLEAVDIFVCGGLGTKVSQRIKKI